MTGRIKLFSNIKNSYFLSASVFLLLFALGIFMFFPLFRIGTPGRSIPLAGQWKISLNDSTAFSFAEYDDTDWGTIDLPGKVVPYSIEQNRGIRGTCWLRKTFFLEDAPGDYGLILGRIANADQTYLNGEKIGETGRFFPNTFSMWNYPRNYLLPDRHLRRGGQNVIAVRVSYDVIGEVMGNLMIVDAGYLRRYTPFARFIHVTIGYAAISIGLVLVLAFLFSRFRYLTFDENYLYFLQFFAGLPIVLDLCLTWEVYPDHTTRLKVLGLSWVAINVFHPAFLHRFYRLKRKWPERILWTYLAACLLGAVFCTHAGNIRPMATLLIGVTWCIGFYNMSCHIEALVRKRDHAKIFSVFGIVTILAAMNDGWCYFNKFVDFNVTVFGWAPTVMVIQTGAIFLYMGTFLVLETKYREMVEEVDDLNRNLENFVLENAFLTMAVKQSRAPKSGPSRITPQAEEKIQAAIDIIGENYLSELSRTDLAKTLDVSPDSLGKQFKQYTGKKLGDYINELRIHEAARRLRETDDKVIHIAFDTGFESLRTFNRVFSKLMNTTPAQYRQETVPDEGKSAVPGN
ncbi:transcriptional regulator, AraC family [Desulfosudis oleivorans Hxd3]|uniref:Transcriptional regulator, AraC family n=2 Tax=Desulfosudis TaxID=2904716 RepID=A8ZWF3_DESOH|nr:transcriptional regulator, AraC family [Desulfosudis oleivorans Hxd3]